MEPSMTLRTEVAVISVASIAAAVRRPSRRVDAFAVDNV